MAFRRGAREPYGIRWFGSTALLGHLRHLTAEGWRPASSTRATGCAPSSRASCSDEVARVLEARGEGATLTERLGRERLDRLRGRHRRRQRRQLRGGRRWCSPSTRCRTGPDASCPRGDLLIFGGDTAYPLSSAPEIARRLTHPWNRVLATPGPAAARPRAARHSRQPRLVRRPRRLRAALPARPAARARRPGARTPRWMKQLRLADSADPQESGRALGPDLPPAAPRRARRVHPASPSRRCRGRSRC